MERRDGQGGNGRDGANEGVALSAPGGRTVLRVDVSGDRPPASGPVERRTLTELGPFVWEAALELENAGGSPLTLHAMDALRGVLAPGAWSAEWFTSSWGAEYAPHRMEVVETLRLETRSGRSSHGTHPWLALARPGAAVIVCPAWSGNWRIRLEDGAIAAGISPWRFAIALEPGETVRAPSVVVAVGASVRDAATTLTGTLGRAWIPRSAASDDLRIEWNHWWAYEDVDVSEDVVLANAEAAASLGIEQVTVDAGWFGTPGRGDWRDARGDWSRVDASRFPSGLTALGAGIRERGGIPGIWIEPESVGRSSELRALAPDLLARSSHDPEPTDPEAFPVPDPDDPSFLGAVCLGSPAGRAFAAAALENVVARTGAEWVKLDFNTDLGSGCTRTDHGHGPADGLFRHYQGLYEVLDDFRARHPEVVLESCSSGGLRLDLGLARHVHCTFLSDPDNTEHHLQVLWGACQLLPPAALLHWSWSQWRWDFEPQRLDFERLSPEDFDTTLRAAMLDRFGVSLRLPDLRPQLRRRLADAVRLYREILAPLVREGTLTPLTAQPLRGGRGERHPAFRLSRGDRHLVAGFRLEGADPPGWIDTGLELGLPSADVHDLSTGESARTAGTRILLDAASGEKTTSWMFLVGPREAVPASSTSSPDRS